MRRRQIVARIYLRTRTLAPPVYCRAKRQFSFIINPVRQWSGEQRKAPIGLKRRRSCYAAAPRDNKLQRASRINQSDYSFRQTAARAQLRLHCFCTGAAAECAELRTLQAQRSRRRCQRAAAAGRPIAANQRCAQYSISALLLLNRLSLLSAPSRQALRARRRRRSISAQSSGRRRRP